MLCIADSTAAVMHTIIDFTALESSLQFVAATLHIYLVRLPATYSSEQLRLQLLWSLDDCTWLIKPDFRVLMTINDNTKVTFNMSGHLATYTAYAYPSRGWAPLSRTLLAGWHPLRLVTCHVVDSAR